jgi:hypothetical protein
MRMRIVVLTAMLLTGCGRPSARLTSEAKPYQPIPVLELTSLTNKDHVVAAYLRHSKGDVVLHLGRTGASYGIEGRAYLDGSVDKPQKIVFDSGKYEDFDCSLDVFHDGRIVLVPLQENSDDAIGAYVNLLSGKKSFTSKTKSAMSISMRSSASANPCAKYSSRFGRSDATSC